MVPSQGNDVNPHKGFKLMTNWKGPYEVVRSLDDILSEFMVRLLVDTRPQKTCERDAFPVPI